MVDTAGITVDWADDEDGPRVYVTAPSRSVTLTVEQANDLDREMGGCLNEIRWHVARWVIVSTWSRGRQHLVSRKSYSEMTNALCGYRPDLSVWSNATPVVVIDDWRQGLCGRCLRSHDRAAIARAKGERP